MIETRDLAPVTAALREYERAQGEAPVMLGGWEIEDAALGAPSFLTRRLAALRTDPQRYAYSRDFHSAKEGAAHLWRESIQIGGEPVTQHHVAVCANSTQALMLALTALRDQGVRRIVIAAPVYYAVIAICQHLALEVVLVAAADFVTGELDIPAIADAMHSPQSALVLTNPAYSLGVEYPSAMLRALFDALPAAAPIVLDETRLGLHWENDAPWYSCSYSAQVLLLRSPSKVFFLNGMKTSFLLGAPGLIQAIEHSSATLLGSSVGNGEAAALAYLAAWEQWQREHRRLHLGGRPVHAASPMLDWRATTVDALRHNLAVLHATLAPHGFVCAPVDSGPYVLVAKPRTAHWESASAQIARACGVLVMTSDYFYHHHPAWWGFRVNLSGCSAQIEQGFARVQAAFPEIFA